METRNGVIVGSDDDIEDGIADAALDHPPLWEWAMSLTDDELLACVNEYHQRIMNRSKGM